MTEDKPVPCDYVIYRVPNNPMPSHFRIENLIPEPCTLPATQTHIYRHARLVEIHGDHEHLCTHHAEEAEKTESLFIFLDTTEDTK